MVRMRFVALLILLACGLWAEVATPSFALLVDGRVVLASTAPGAVIRYTFDEKEPDRSAGVYLAPINIPFGRTLRARAFSSDGVAEPSTIGSPNCHARHTARSRAE